MDLRDRSEQDKNGGGVSRRVIVKGAAWSMPVIAASVAAPAHATSVPACHDYFVDLGSQYQRVSDYSGTITVPGQGGAAPIVITLTATFSGTGVPESPNPTVPVLNLEGRNVSTPAGMAPGIVLAQHNTEGVANGQTLAMSFSRPVEAFSYTVGAITGTPTTTENGAYEDVVAATTGGFTATTSAMSSTNAIAGTGTIADPWRREVLTGGAPAGSDFTWYRQVAVTYPVTPPVVELKYWSLAGEGAADLGQAVTLYGLSFRAC